MSKFNEKNTNKTENRSGFQAYEMSDKDRLVTAVLTTMFGEPKYYGSTDNEVISGATALAGSDPEFIYHLACYARNVANMRSVSHVLTAIIAHEAREYTRATIRNVVVRPDDITEIMSCYKLMYGKPFPNALKREIANVIQKFDEYQLAKYNGGHKSMKFRDVIRITHPVPKDKDAELLLGKVLRDELETPYTWEAELSERGNTREVWTELIASGKVGYMALLRNLRNIILSGADYSPVLEKLSDPEYVHRSRQLPFRFFSAYRTLKEAGLLTPGIHKALELAVTASIDNMEPIPGRTMIAIDCSGSMCKGISSKSTIRCCDLSALLGAIASRLCEDATVCYFNQSGDYDHLFNKTGYAIAHYGKYESILEICDKTSYSDGGTDMSLPLEYMLKKDNAVHSGILDKIRGSSDILRPFDRIIYFSDNECNAFSHPDFYYKRNCQGLIDKYRSKYNEELWVHAVDLQGYGTQQFIGKNFNVIAGWSEKVFPFIMLAERGISTLTKTIEEYDPEAGGKNTDGASEEENL